MNSLGPVCARNGYILIYFALPFFFLSSSRDAFEPVPYHHLKYRSFTTTSSALALTMHAGTVSILTSLRLGDHFTLNLKPKRKRSALLRRQQRFLLLDQILTRSRAP